MIKYICYLALLATSLHAKESLPNIIVFLVDDMGLMDTSVPMITDSDGQPQPQPLNAWYQTPSMERLAEQGTRFSNFYAHSVCSPSRTSLLTGQNSARHHITDWLRVTPKENPSPNSPEAWQWKGIDRHKPTLPRILSQHGYRSIIVGKGHFGPRGEDGANPRNLGFDVSIASNEIGHPGSYYGEDGYGQLLSGIKKDRTVPDLEQYHGTDTFLTEALTLEAIKVIDQAALNNQPFFLYLSHYAAHTPFQSDPRFADRYNNRGRSEREQAFATLIEGMDKSLGDILDYLEASGIAENTLIFFLGDNGSDAPSGGSNEIASSAPLRGKKSTAWEGGVRVPFIAAWAKVNPQNYWQQKLPITPGNIQTRVGAIYDIFPTVTELVDIKAPANHTVDGRSLQLYLDENLVTENKGSFLSHYPHKRKQRLPYTTYRSDDWKLMYNYFAKNRDTRYELYNLTEDINETNNVAADHPERLSDLMAEMVVLLETKNAQYPTDQSGNVIEPILP